MWVWFVGSFRTKNKLSNALQICHETNSVYPPIEQTIWFAMNFDYRNYKLAKVYNSGRVFQSLWYVRHGHRHPLRHKSAFVALGITHTQKTVLPTLNATVINVNASMAKRTVKTRQKVPDEREKNLLRATADIDMCRTHSILERTFLLALRCSPKLTDARKTARNTNCTPHWKLTGMEFDNHLWLVPYFRPTMTWHWHETFASAYESHCTTIGRKYVCLRITTVSHSRRRCVVASVVTANNATLSAPQTNAICLRLRTCERTMCVAMCGVVYGGSSTRQRVIHVIHLNTPSRQPANPIWAAAVAAF